MQNRNSMATRQFEAENMQTENTDGLVSESLKMNRSTVCVKQGLKNFTSFKMAYKHAVLQMLVGQLKFNKICKFSQFDCKGFITELLIKHKDF